MKKDTIPIEDLRQIRQSVIEKRNHLERNEVLVALFGPFSSKYEIHDVLTVEKITNKKDDGGNGQIPKEFLKESCHHYSNDPTSIGEKESTFISDLKSELRKEGVNAFVASKIPPFGDSDFNQEWREYVDNELIEEDWNYIKQSYLYALMANINVFSFRYFGNPVGVTYEIADTMRGIGFEPEQCIAFFESDLRREENLYQKYTKLSEDRIEERLEHQYPNYLSSMLEHLPREHSIWWEHFEDIDKIIRHICNNVEDATAPRTKENYTPKILDIETNS